LFDNYKSRKTLDLTEILPALGRKYIDNYSKRVRGGKKILFRRHLNKRPKIGDLQSLDF
jgi:hypothetical protein